jgi:serine/threonine protein kinase
MSHLRSETRVARIIIGIVLAMRYIHSWQVIRYDLKPENILLDCGWNVRIADFGCSIWRDDPAIFNAIQK